MKKDHPTSFDIAYRAGVSQSTVSRALRDSPLVSVEKRNLIKAIAAELNYKVDRVASSMRARSTKTLALLIREDPTTDGSLINPFFLSMLGGITRATAQRGFDLLVSFQQQSSDWHADYQYAHRADGLILLGYGDYSSAAPRLQQLSEAGGRFVIWGPDVSGQGGCSLGCDNETGGFRAVRHLLAQGRKRIAFLGTISDHFPEFHARYRGYLRALATRRIRPDPLLQVDAESIESSGIESATELLDRKRPFDAVFATSDLIAIGAIAALQDRGLAVPRDVAVVGFDDIPLAAYVNPPLTTVRQDTRRAGERLVDMLIRSLDGEDVQSELLEPELIVRASCGAAAPAKAVRRSRRR